MNDTIYHHLPKTERTVARFIKSCTDSNMSICQKIILHYAGRPVFSE